MRKRKGLKGFFGNLWRYKALVLMAIPGMIWMIFFFLHPVLANVVAFKISIFLRMAFLPV